MDEKTFISICEQVYHRFPEVKGARPNYNPCPKDLLSQHVLIFSGKAMAKMENPFKGWCRVVVGDNGKIVKMSTSK